MKQEIIEYIRRNEAVTEYELADYVHEKIGRFTKVIASKLVDIIESGALIEFSENGLRMYAADENAEFFIQEKEQCDCINEYSCGKCGRGMCETYNNDIYRGMCGECLVAERLEQHDENNNGFHSAFR